MHSTVGSRWSMGYKPVHQFSVNHVKKTREQACKLPGSQGDIAGGPRELCRFLNITGSTTIAHSGCGYRSSLNRNLPALSDTAARHLHALHVLQYVSERGRPTSGTSFTGEKKKEKKIEKSHATSRTLTVSSSASTVSVSCHRISRTAWIV